MAQVLIATSVWLHGLATVVFIGYYVLLALIYLPALRDAAGDAGGAVISAVSKRSRAWLYSALVVFALTGFYLMRANPDYHGIGNFANPWSITMLLKHSVILVMLIIGYRFNALLKVGPLAGAAAGGTQSIARFRAYTNSMAACGVVVLLLTAFAQAQ